MFSGVFGMLVTDMLGGQVMINTAFTRGAFDSEKRKTVQRGDILYFSKVRDSVV